MPSVDDRIVSIEFDNSGFDRRLNDTIASLDRLSETIRLVGAQQGFDAVNAAANAFDTSNMASAVDNISSKFTALGAIGFSILQQLTQNVLSFATNIVKEDVLGPIITGGRQRALNIEQAKFQFRGLGVDVQSGMDSALAAVKNTAFGLDEAAKAASQLSASGIQTGDQMTGILRGIAGTAAMTGSSFSEMADIFTASAGSGKVNTQDLLQFSTRGLNAAAAVAKQMGLTEAQVRDMASSGKLDFKTFADAMNGAFGEHATKANETYAGSLANLHAAMSRLGASFFGEKLTQQRDLFNALTPVIDDVAAAMKPLIDAFNAVGRLTTNSLIDKLKGLDLSGFKASMPNFAEGIINAFAGVTQFLGVIRDAFRDIFPPTTFSLFVKISEVFKAFTESLKMGGETADKLRSVFRGLFAIMEIGWTIFKELFSVVRDIVKAIFPASTGFLNLAAAGGDLATKLNEFLVGGGRIHAFFQTLRDVVQGPIEFIQKLKDKIVDLAGVIALFFSNLDIFGGGTKGVETGLGNVDTKMDKMRDTADKVRDAWQRLMDRLHEIFGVFDKIWDYIKGWFGQLGSKIAEAFHPGDFNAAVDIINVGLLGGIAYMLDKFLKGGVLKQLGGNLVDKLGGMLDTISAKAQAMTTNVKADTLIKIAEAIAILAASVVVLSLIDPAKLTKALVAIAVGLGELGVMLFVLDKVFSGASSLKLGIMGVALIELSTSILILSAALKIMGTMSWDQIKNGLDGIAIGLGLMIGTVKILGKDPQGMISAGLGMIVISTGLLVLSKAVASFATMDWATMMRGLAGVAIGLAAVTLALKFMPPAGAISGLGLIEVAIGLNILAAAVKIFATISWGDMLKGMVGVGIGLTLISLALNAMPAIGAISGLGFIEVAIGLNILAAAVLVFATISWGDMFKGMVGIGAGLAIIAIAMNAMPLSMVLIGPALVVVATALGILAEVLRVIGSMDLGSLVKGIVGFGAMLLILAVGVNAMSGALAGAAALVVVAGAMTILTNVLTNMAGLSWNDLLRGLVGIAAVLALLGIAALVMEPLLPALFGLGLALGVVGVAFALFGVGAYLVATAIQTMAESGVAGAKAFVESVKIMVSAIPEIMKAIVLAFIGSSTELLAAVPLLIRVVAAILDQLLTTIIELAPKIADALTAVIHAILDILRENFPDYVQTGLEMLMALLQGIRDNIGEITTLVAEIIVNFIDALTAKLPDIVTAVYNFIIELATQLAEKAGEFQTAFIPIGEAFIKGLIQGLEDNLGGVLSWFTELPGKLIDLVKSLFGISSPSTKFMEIGADIISGLFWGLVNAVGSVWNFFVGLPGQIFGWIGNTAVTLISKGWDFIIGLLQGIGEKERDVMGWLLGLGGRLFGWVGDISGKLWRTGWDLIVGLWNGIWGKVQEVRDWLLGFGNMVYGWVGDISGKLWQTGYDVLDGLWNGMKEGWNHVTSWLSKLDPRNWFNDIALKPGHADKNLFYTGQTVMGGLQGGMEEGWSSVTSWMQKLNPADHINIDLSSVVKQISDQLSGMDEFNPVITPVLDLTKVQEGSANLEQYMRLSPITPDVSFDQARLISAAAVAASAPTTPAYTGPTEVTFEQNIYAPTQLSTNDIYRNTKSQIALAKEDLGIK